MIDAIERINEARNNGDSEFKDKTSIFMISPALVKQELKQLESLGFETEFISKKQLQNEEFCKEHPETALPISIFGKDHNVGSASISFEKINSKEFKDAAKAYKELAAKKGITIEDKDKPQDDGPSLDD